MSARAARRMRQRLAEARRELDALCRAAPLRDPLGPVRNHVQRLDELAHRLRDALRHRSAEARRQADGLAGRLAGLHPAHLRDRAAADVDRLLARLRWALGGRSKHAGEAVSAAAGRLLAASPVHRLELARQQVSAAARQLEAMSYRAVLRRGFSVTRSQSGSILRSAGEAAAGELIETELADGRVSSRVTGGEAPAPEAGGRQGGEAAPETRRRKNTGHPRQGPRGPAGPSLFEEPK